ncbi:MAG: sodium:proton antiporter NhaD [Bacteroidota bacterium]
MATTLDLTHHWSGWLSLLLFVGAYLLVMSEEFLHLRKSKPVLVAAGIIWLLIGSAYALHGDRHTAETLVRESILEYGELFLFLLAAMTFINTLEDRGLFDTLRAWLVGRGLSLRALFWATGALAFFISPFADNMTTALVMGAIAMAVGRGNPSFISLACINIVVGANAGGAFSPFGDITTLMVWQKGLVPFFDFFRLFVPSFLNWFVPAFLMSFAVSRDCPPPIEEKTVLQPGALGILLLFVGTIFLSVIFHSLLGMPPVLGMTTGLGLLKFYGFYLKRRPGGGYDPLVEGENRQFDIFKQIERAEWDTLMFFFEVIACVGGLGAIGYLALASQALYGGLGATAANTLIGLLSAVIDNIPIMVAVISMNPAMPVGQWLLVTLTAGVGGSLLSIGSAAGVALMGQARGQYTFFSHLKWSWAVLLGYFAAIGAHLLLNRGLF